jgi:hypothetical protein
MVKPKKEYISVERPIKMRDGGTNEQKKDF